MVTPAMQQQPPPVIYGPNGERAEWNGREYIVAAPQSGPQQGPIPGLIQMTTPAEQRAREEREYDRQRDAVRDERLDRTEERAVAAAERQARTEERTIEQQQRAGTPESRGRLATAIGPSVLAQDSLARQEVDESGRGVNPLNRDWGAAALDSVPDFGILSPIARAWGGQDYQDYNQSLKTVEASLLPVFSGMAVTPQEAQRFIRANQPQIGDSPETLQRKARNRQTILNEAADMLQRPIPYPEIGRYGEEGFRERASQDGGGVPPPTVNDGRTVQPADSALAVAPGEYAADYVARFDRDGDNRASVEEMQAAGWQFDYQQGKWFPPGSDVGGNEPPAPPAGPQGGQPPQGPQGGTPQSQGYRTALEQERANADLVSRAGGGYGMTDALTGEFNDELAYGAGYLTQGLGNIGRRLTGREIEVSAQDRARASRDVMAQDRDEFARERPVQNFTGNVLGAAAFGPQGAARTMVGRMAQGAGMGATYGFAGAEGNVVERLPEAAIGAGVGAIAVPVVEKAVAPAINALARPVIQGAQSSGRFLGRQAGNVGNALGIPGSQRLVANNQPNPLASGMNRFADRMGAERVNALNPNLATARNNGLDQADLIDVLDDGSIGRMRALATRDTPGRDRMVQSAERRRANLPSRAARIASEEISQDTRPAIQAIDDLSATRRANASAIDNFGADEVPLSQDAILALRSDFVRPHIRAAAQRAQGSTDPVEREAAARLNRLAEEVLDNPGQARLTVREAQDISKALNDAATSAFRNNPADGQVLANLGRSVRQTARDNSQGYDSWLRQYGDDSDLIEAATTGRNFVSVSKDPASARGTEAFVQRAQQAGPAELGIQRAAAREAVEVAGSNPSGARTVLEGFANDAGQARRAAALGADAGRLQARASAELDSVTRHQRASPRIGSESSVNLQDSAGAAGAVVGTARDVMTANVPGLASRAMNAIRSRGFSNQEAEAIVMAANNPAQTDQLVAMLAERMTRREARSLARAIRYQVTTSLPTNQ